MASNGEKYFRSDGEDIYLKAPYCEFYIPEDLFKSTAEFAVDKGDKLRGIGLFDVGFFENGKLIEMRTLNVPTWIELYKYEVEDRMVQLPHSDKMEPCKVLIYYEGQKIMKSFVIEDSTNVLIFLKQICAGKMPRSVPYSKSSLVWKKNQSLNGVGLGVPAVIEELILSVSYRDKNNPGQKFAQVAGRDLSVSDYDCTMASIRQICQYASTFTALWFEDFDSMVTTSLNRTATKANETESPLEKIIKM